MDKLLRVYSTCGNHITRRYWDFNVKSLRRCFVTLTDQNDCKHTKGFDSIASSKRTLYRHGYHHRQIKFQDSAALKKELSACLSLLQRSGSSTSPAAVSSFINEGISWIRGSPAQKQYDKDRGGRGQQQPNKENEEDPNEEPEMMQVLVKLMSSAGLLYLLYIMLRKLYHLDDDISNFVSWREFVHEMLTKGEVEEITVRPQADLAFVRLYPGAIVKGRKVDNDLFTIKINSIEKFERKLRKVEKELGVKSGVPISYQRESSGVGLVWTAIIAGVLFLVFSSMVKLKIPNSMDIMGERKAKFLRADLQILDGKSITFRDVAGLHEAKVEIMEFVDYLKKPDRFEQLGAKIPHGALLTGPPGCGKTLLARAVATEAKVPFLAMAGSEFIDMIGGVGAARVRDLFEQAREKAPCIIFVDEIDTIGRKRGGGKNMSSSEQEQTLNQLLVEMDGISTTGGVIMLASTNREDVLDKALLRKGRFDRHIDIGLPTLLERKEIFEMYLGRLKLKQPPTAYSDNLSHLSPGMSGADIANVCNEAALHAARFKKTAIGESDFDYAVERIVAGVAKKSRVLSPHETRVVAYHEAGHALVGWLLEHTDPLMRVSIVPRTTAALGFAQYMPRDKHLHSKEELFERMCMALGGRVSESLTFNSVTSGAQDDLKKVTKIAYSQIRSLGMNERVGHLSFPQSGSEFGSKPYSKQLAYLMDEEAKRLVARAYLATEKLLQENKEKLRVIAEALLEKEALNYADMEQLIGPPKFEKKVIMPEIAQPPTSSLQQ